MIKAAINAINESKQTIDTLRDKCRRRSICIALTNGCPRSKVDIASLFRYFQSNGWKVTNQIRRADIVLVSTCGFDVKSEDESIRLLTIADNKRKKDSELVVIGCLAGINRDRIRSEFNATTLAPAELDSLDELIEAQVKLRNVQAVNNISPYVARATSHWRYRRRYNNNGRIGRLIDGTVCKISLILALVGAERVATSVLQRLRKASKGRKRVPIFSIRVARGCLEECSFCAIRSAVGPLRSKSLDDILLEFRRGLRQGSKLFEIIAEDVGAYGQDIGTNMVELITHLFSLQGDYQIIFTDINIRHMIRSAMQMTVLLASNVKKVSLIKMSVQSGSDKILRLMRRGYTAAQAKECLRQLRRACPGIPLETHVLVGFPGETDEDFRLTVEFLRAVRFDSIQVYRYTHRPGTASSQMESIVPQAITDNRARRILNLFPGSYLC